MKKKLIQLVIAFLALMAVVVAARFLIDHLRSPKTPAAVAELPEYTGKPTIKVNGNKPVFTDKQIKRKAYEKYSDLDPRGRCKKALACIGPESMPTGERGLIGHIKPTGWKYSKYDFIDNGGYLYNRCHLIGWQLTGQNAEVRNLITGTRYMNTEGMLPYENKVADYIRRTGNHVMYRVTPVFRGKEMLARGVEIEAMSVEDSGKGISFNIYCYNVQPGVEISYKDGDNWLIEEDTDGQTASGKNGGKTGSSSGKSGQKKGGNGEPYTAPKGVTFIVNTNTNKFHKPTCPSVQDMSERNRLEFTGSRDEAVAEGYEPCGSCKP